jgi:hypothetical protein
VSLVELMAAATTTAITLISKNTTGRCISAPSL